MRVLIQRIGAEQLVAGVVHTVMGWKESVLLFNFYPRSEGRKPGLFIVHSEGTIKSDRKFRLKK
jgi:hypothetical protein